MSGLKTTTIYIVRHGQSEGNLKSLRQGHLDFPLTTEGKKQSRKLGQELKHIKFDAVFSSDLMRAKKTAEIVALEQDLTVNTTKLLRERNSGKFVGELSKTMQAELGRMLARYRSLSDEEKYRFKFAEDAESNEELTLRLLTFLRETAAAYLGKTVLVVSHGGVMRALLVYLGFATWDELPSGQIKNTGYLKLESDGTNFFVSETKGITKSQSLEVSIE